MHPVFVPPVHDQDSAGCPRVAHGLHQALRAVGKALCPFQDNKFFHHLDLVEEY